MNYDQLRKILNKEMKKLSKSKLLKHFDPYIDEHILGLITGYDNVLHILDELEGKAPLTSGRVKMKTKKVNK